MTTATNYNPITYESDFSWYYHDPYERFVNSLGFKGLGDRIEALRAQYPYFPERLIEEVNFLLDKGLDPREAIKQYDDQPATPGSRITEGSWPGIAGNVIIDDPLNEYAFVLGFPDGSHGVAKEARGNCL